MPWDLGASTLEVASQPANGHLQNERERSPSLMLNEMQHQVLVRPADLLSSKSRQQDSQRTRASSIPLLH
jgi:hypothetical protein